MVYLIAFCLFVILTVLAIFGIYEYYERKYIVNLKELPKSNYCAWCWHKA